MHPVRNACNRHFVDWNARPHILPKRPTNFTVQFADPIGVPAETQRQNGHAELLIWIKPRLAEREQLFQWNVEFSGKFPEIFLHHLPRE